MKMNRRKRYTAGICLGLAAGMVLFAGCSAGAVPEDAVSPPAEEIIAGDVRENEEQHEQQRVAAPDIAEQMNVFSFTMGSTLYQEYEGENFVNSPLSLWIPLAALLNATEESVREEVLSGLGLTGATIAQVNEAAASMLYDLNKEQTKKIYAENGEEYDAPLTIANMVLVDQEYTITEEFQAAFADYYGGEAMTVDFTGDEAVTAINEWAAEKTKGKLEQVVESLDPDTVAAIANAIYFSDAWGKEFNKQETYQDVFYGEQAELTADYMVRSGSGQSYYEDEVLQATALEFAQGGSLYIFLPKEESASAVFTQMDMDYFAAIRDGMEDQASGTLELPKFSIDGDAMDLIAVLDKLQIPYTDSARMVLTELVTDENAPLYVSSAVQKAMIEVDEKGATAAAVTVMSMETLSLIIEEPAAEFEMICNKPFFFVLTDCRSDSSSQILFTGVVNVPEYEE